MLRQAARGTKRLRFTTFKTAAPFAPYMPWPFLKRSPSPTPVRLAEAPRFVARWLAAHDLTAQLLRHRGALADKQAQLARALDALDAASLLNERIPERAKHAMDGNRQHYVAALRRLVERNHFSEDPADLLADLDAFAMALHDTTPRIQRNFAVLKEFFNNEVGATGKALHDLETAAEAAREELGRGPYQAALRLHSLLEQHAQDRKTHAGLAARRRALDDEAARLDAERAAWMATREALAASESARDLARIEAVRSQAASTLASCEGAIRALLGPLERPLRKFARIAPPLAARYADHPLKTLGEDDSLALQGILADLAGQLPTLLDGDKAQRAAAALARARAADWPQLRTAYQGASAACAALAGQLATHPYRASQRDLEAALGELEAAQARLADECRDLERFAAATDPDRHRPAIREALQALGATLQ